MGSINLRGEPYKKLCLELKIMPLHLMAGYRTLTARVVVRIHQG